MPVNEHKLTFLEVKQRKRNFILSVLPASVLVAISYAAVRRQQDEEGAVQRVLNQSRIASIKNFAAQGGDLPACIVLNWVRKPLNRQGGLIILPEIPRAAQIIDGQHRVAGLEEAIKENRAMGDVSVPVAIYENLDTRACADIFLSINTEQRPAPKSLVTDLYGIASEEFIDKAALRARDIAMALNEQGQAYEGWIKLPNAKRQKGGIALSTAASAIKPLVDEKGPLEQIGANTFELQKAIFCNLFSSLSEKYAESWGELKNAFMFAAGFLGAIEFLQAKLIPYCNTKQDFSKELMLKVINLDSTNLILQEEVKGLGGKDAPKRVFDRLVAAFTPEEISSGNFKV